MFILLNLSGVPSPSPLEILDHETDAAIKLFSANLLFAVHDHRDAQPKSTQLNAHETINLTIFRNGDG
jgi:hypothetical protein